MKRTSPSCRSVRSAARSPARVSTGPEVMRKPGTHLGGHDPGQRGLAQTRAVRRRGGGRPAARRCRAAWRTMPRCSTSWAWPDELGQRPGPEAGLLDLLDRVGHDRRHQPASRARRLASSSVGQHLPAGPRAHRLASSRRARRSISSTPTSSRRPSSAPRISSGA